MQYICKLLYGIDLASWIQVDPYLAFVVVDNNADGDQCLHGKSGTKLHSFLGIRDIGFFGFEPLNGANKWVAIVDHSCICKCSLS